MITYLILKCSKNKYESFISSLSTELDSRNFGTAEIDNNGSTWCVYVNSCEVERVCEILEDMEIEYADSKDYCSKLRCSECMKCVFKSEENTYEK